MPRAVEIISGKVTNPSTTFTTLTMATGDSATVRAMASGSGYMHNAWSQEATAGFVRVRSPRMHDNLQNIRAATIAATPRPLWPDSVSQLLYSQDNLVLDMTGGASETDVASFLVDYDDVGGIQARFATWDEIAPRMANLIGVQTQHTIGSGAGDYSGSVAINSFEDIFKANVDYAILGFVVDAVVASIGWKGPDTGNLRVGGPGTIDPRETREWFVDLGRKTGRPFIPIINAANKFGTFVDLLSTATSGTRNVVTYYAQLR